ncbi:rhodanese-like domain-containing protein [Aestuariivivens insulae]|uniref:rhodanese-like domain-containing protein n=1 Tax=Aestuariivivens insulae TaxID=1621988 RepID=UPI001F56D862|nr:rhodanese-like domain-containing protein [Aestuariivivens insulae]
MNHSNVTTSKKAIPQVTSNQLDAIIAEEHFSIIDVRNPKGIESQGSIPKAHNIPFETIEHAVDKEHEDYNPIFDGDGPFLFCCTGGVMSYMAALKAQEKGVENVHNLEGGHAAWLKFKNTQN